REQAIGGDAQRHALDRRECPLENGCRARAAEEPVDEEVCELETEVDHALLPAAVPDPGEKRAAWRLEGTQELGERNLLHHRESQLEITTGAREEPALERL